MHGVFVDIEGFGELVGFGEIVSGTDMRNMEA